MRFSLMRISFLACFVAVTLSATPLVVSAGGTFAGKCPISQVCEFGPAPATAFSYPDASWNVSFEVDSNPAVGFSSVELFVPAITNFQYSVDGMSITPYASSIIFVNGLYGGGFEVLLSARVDEGYAFYSMYLKADQLYAGPESALSILTGAYQTNRVGLTWDNRVTHETYRGDQPNAAITITGIATPEPGGIALLGIGLSVLGLSGVRARIKRPKPLARQTSASKSRTLRA